MGTSRRFSREWHRERAELARAEADATAETLYRLRVVVHGRDRHHNWRVRAEDTVPPYRGFRAGRSRVRPDETGYDEPARHAGADEFWVVDLPVAPEVIGDVLDRDR
ncbi:hypothetical protein [Kibdelosporangium phytohabitans]|uniref:Uncharacterized protein n=1 Tax=Kibdelosporangium phytohabitans TaxID=860235 RepID=A0A0N9I5L0_9PSEU|nr:hypothetical protein [Kibdelosporangium phytohabitans]ALG09867.1 hypothetical protein AOZ06_25870 [Kibdelosporangium phytohabitans]MBE1468736.1 hypothetical protein [Kibdelosporangium phytohabitans]